MSGMMEFLSFLRNEERKGYPPDCKLHWQCADIPQFERAPKAEIGLITSARGSFWQRSKKSPRKSAGRQWCGWPKAAEKPARRLLVKWASRTRPSITGAKSWQRTVLKRFRGKGITPGWSAKTRSCGRSARYEKSSEHLFTRKHMKYPYAEHHTHECPVAGMCQVLGFFPKVDCVPGASVLPAGTTRKMLN
jgi:hypothetical protein